MSSVVVKSIVLFNLDDIITANAKKLLDFIFQYNISNKQDIYSLFVFYNLSDILDVYKNNGGMIVFYLSAKCHNWLLEEEGIVRGMDFKKFIKLITKRIRFPIIISNLSFNGFKHMLEDNGPEYDELIADYEFISSLFDDIVRVIKNLRFYQLQEDFLSSIKDQIKLISTF